MRTFIYITRDGDFKIIDAPDARRAENIFRSKHGFTGARHGNVTDITEAIFEHIGRIEWKSIEAELIGKMQEKMRQAAEVRGIRLHDEPVIVRPIRGHIADQYSGGRIKALDTMIQPPNHPNCRSAPPSGPGWTPEGRAKLVDNFNRSQRAKKWRRLRPYIIGVIGAALILGGLLIVAVSK